MALCSPFRSNLHARKMGAEGGAAADLHRYDIKMERDGGYQGTKPRKTEGGEN